MAHAEEQDGEGGEQGGGGGGGGHRNAFYKGVECWTSGFSPCRTHELQGGRRRFSESRGRQV